MQRRQGRDLAYISPPPGMGGGHDKGGSRSGQRRFGIPNRVWALFAVVALVLTVTLFISRPSSPKIQSQPTYSNADLKPKNYFNVTNIGPNPFDFCPSHGVGDELGAKYGSLTLTQSRSHVGTKARIQRLLGKALAGRPITISVIGGSVSACHGAGDDPISSSCYPSKFFQWWNSVFPHPGTELTNGAMRRTDSNYFGYCNVHHLPDLTDLVIIELDTDDAPSKEMMEHFETLIRSILIRPDQPAVVILGHFSPQVLEAHGFVGADHWHSPVAVFYDVPHITIKPVMYPKYMNDPKSVEEYFVDPVLASPAGHQVLTDMLVAFFQSQICEAWEHAEAYSNVDGAPMAGKAPGDSNGLFGGVGQRKGVPEPGEKADSNPDDAPQGGDKKAVKGLPQLVAQYQVPSARMDTRPNSARPFEEISPFCVSANDLINPLPPSLFYGSGWTAHHPTSAGGSSLRTTAHYWSSTLPTSKIRIPMQVGAGDIAVYYLKEPVSVVGEGSSVECWVDDNYGGAKVIENVADIGEAQPALAMIDHFVSRGSHFVECKLNGEEGQTVPAFKLLGVFST